ncbi:endoplasmic reticulum lectin 1-like [Sycon ciliatum]|uniref:endoplasmic reticulum lectin 1-like n=1 Tax=Sycon ciliatum TaxID=27933 RepID=UPI0020AE2214|eukprot:scpid67957/ scgid10744/ Endoplasmic reticulum lectin 1; ER lectin
MDLVTLSSALVVLVIASCCTGTLSPFDDSIRYDISWSPVLDSSELSKFEKDVTYIRTPDNERYACRLPSGDDSSKENSERDEGQSLSAEVLLEPLIRQQKCLQDAHSYWTYEYCFGGKVRQFHAEVVDGRRKVTAEYILGKDVAHSKASVSSVPVPATEKPQRIPKRRIGEQNYPYYSVLADDGTPCDLSGTPRHAEIIFVCLEDIVQTRLISVKETQTCEYEAIVAAPQLCTNPDYRLPKDEVHGIQCSPVGGSPVKPSSLIEGKPSASTEFVHLELGGTDKLIFLRAGTEQQKQQQQRQQQQQQRQSQAGSMQDEPSETMTFLGEAPANDEMSASAAASGRPRTPAHPEAPLSPDKSMINQFLNGDFCLDGGSGWWMYEFCFGKQVLQYHREPNSKKRVEILLGRWDKKVHVQWMSQAARRKKKGHYYYSNGDVCDVTSKPRSVTVRMRCKSGEFHPSQVAMSLQEPSTCNYILTVESPIFCKLLDNLDEDGFVKPSQ